jgi:hypothetical protein
MLLLLRQTSEDTLRIFSPLFQKLLTATLSQGEMEALCCVLRDPRDKHEHTLLQVIASGISHHDPNDPRADGELIMLTPSPLAEKCQPCQVNVWCITSSATNSTVPCLPRVLCSSGHRCFGPHVK